jgi:hypothetical protein
MQNDGTEEWPFDESPSCEGIDMPGADYSKPNPPTLTVKSRTAPPLTGVRKVEQLPPPLTEVKKISNAVPPVLQRPR